MGGSSQNKSDISSLSDDISKKFYFFDNFKVEQISIPKKHLNLIISKSGNTLETISNLNVFIKKKDENVFLTENKKSYIFSLAKKLKSEIVHHNNFIGGRYSVLSEVGMLPAELMGLKPSKFRQLNNLIKDKKFLNCLIANVNSITSMTKSGKSNSIILNYDPKLTNFLEWYKQLVGESLGKKGKGILPVISEMPKDNHSVMQLYLDGIENNSYFFFLKDQSLLKIYSKIYLKIPIFKNKSLYQIK